MKKLFSAPLVLSFLSLISKPVFAACDPNNVLCAGVRRANGTINANTSVGSIVTFLVAFIIVLATLAALFFIVLGAFQWITSGGDKTKVDSARNHIIAAVIGLVIIALSFVIINVVISALGLGSLTDLQIPTLQSIQNNTP